MLIEQHNARRDRRSIVISAVENLQVCVKTFLAKRNQLRALPTPRTERERVQQRALSVEVSALKEYLDDQIPAVGGLRDRFNKSARVAGLCGIEMKIL